MYLPRLTEETDTGELHRFIRAHPLGALVHAADGTLDADHLPFLLDASDGPAGTLIGHVARANPLWQTAAAGMPVLVIFRGAEGYISPNWYPGKQDTHRRVPTWNYEVVHAHGTLHVHDDARVVRGVVARLTRAHEAGQPVPWKMTDAPADYLDAMLDAIVGIEVRITRLVGKRKLNQHHAAADREGAVAGLEAAGNAALADAMRAAGRSREDAG